MSITAKIKSKLIPRKPQNNTDSVIQGKEHEKENLSQSMPRAYTLESDSNRYQWRLLTWQINGTNAKRIYVGQWTYLANALWQLQDSQAKDIKHLRGEG